MKDNSNNRSRNRRKYFSIYICLLYCFFFFIIILYPFLCVYICIYFFFCIADLFCFYCFMFPLFLNLFTFILCLSSFLDLLSFLFQHIFSLFSRSLGQKSTRVSLSLPKQRHWRTISYSSNVILPTKSYGRARNNRETLEGLRRQRVSVCMRVCVY